MSDFRLIPIEDLSRRSDTRREDIGATSNLADSIAEVGLTNPITVRAKPDGCFEIIAGSHRYAACDSLGHHEIMCQVVELDDLHAELAMIDENLCRAEVSGVLLEKQLGRRKEIYVELHPETRVGENQHTRVRQNGEGSLAERFTAETAALTGKSERTIQRAVERGEKITVEAANLVHGTPLDRGTYRDELKQVPREEQVEKVRVDLAEPLRPRAAPTAAAPKREPPAPVRKMEPGQAYTRFVGLVDEIEAIGVRDILNAAPKKSVLGQRASGLADMMNDIVEGLAQ